jgi:NAD(P)H-dependent FMN reductase
LFSGRPSFGVVAARDRTYGSTSAATSATPTLAEYFESAKKPTIVTICGSQREGSFNQMLHDASVANLEQLGATVNVVDLQSLELPLYDPNREEDHFPEAARQLKKALTEADGIFVACPEYNGFVTPLLLNSITWATRGEGDMYSGFKGKVCSLMATSPGPMGGLRMLRSLTTMMEDMGSTVVAGHNSIGGAFKVFDPKTGAIVDETTQAKIDAATGQLYHFARYEVNRERDCGIYHQIQNQKNMGEYGSVDL